MEFVGGALSRGGHGLFVFMLAANGFGRGAPPVSDAATALGAPAALDEPATAGPCKAAHAG